jgi:lipoprotein-releasing system ATP-binding protein
MEQSVLHAKKVNKTYIQGDKEIRVLKDLSISFEQGKTYAITGASGSGKSTLLHLLGGIDTPTKGSIFFNDEDYVKMQQGKKEKLLNTSLGFVFQFHYLVNELTVLENIMLMGLINGSSKELCQKEALRLLNHFGLKDKAKNYPYQLSGGEQQRVSIIRSIFNKPVFLLADEPTGNLDATNAERTIDFFLTCQKEWGMGLILCSHDKFVYERMEQVFELKDGTLSPV